MAAGVSSGLGLGVLKPTLKCFCFLKLYYGIIFSKLNLIGFWSLCQPIRPLCQLGSGSNRSGGTFIERYQKPDSVSGEQSSFVERGLVLPAVIVVVSVGQDLHRPALSLCLRSVPA